LGGSLLNGYPYLCTCGDRRNIKGAELPNFSAADFHVLPSHLGRKQEVVGIEVDALNAVVGRVRVTDQGAA
jgi:hypothetical protein